MAGKRGAQLGNQNGRKGAEWLAALRWALKHYDRDPNKREQAIERCVKKARTLRAIAMRVVVDAREEGKEAAIREISERLDGKVGAGAGDSSVRVVLLKHFPEDDAQRVIEGEAVRLPN